MLFSSLPKIASGKLIQLVADQAIEGIITDSRKPAVTPGACFFALKGPRHDGHRFIKDLYDLGVRQFVIEQELGTNLFPEANIFVSTSALEVLQRLAAEHRKQFSYPVIGITGSNGKTIIKEWLFQLLSPDFHVVKNPGSYNSQLGVPLSVLQMRPHHQLAIFEAGVSRPGEMEKLARIIEPTLGIFTNIGSAHDEGFASRTEKIREKLQFLPPDRPIIFCADQEGVSAQIEERFSQRLAWGSSEKATYRTKRTGNVLEVNHQQKTEQFPLPFSEPASVENLTHCIVALLYFGISVEVIRDRIGHLRSVPMRLEMKQGINQCQLIDDSYNNDLAGLQISLNFLTAQQKSSKTLILSDVLQSGMGEDDLIQSIAALLRQAGLQQLVGVGPVLSKHTEAFKFIPQCFFYRDTDELLQGFDWERLQHSVVLVKGARVFQFEKVVQRLQKKIHGTVMEIDLNAMVNNLNFFRARLKPGVKLMVMVKAFAYGSGSEEVANLLQYHKVDYLGVAYADEGVDLRKNKISLPIMVMNPSEESFSLLLQHNLEPEVYSLKILRSLISFLQGRLCRVHLKLDTGMHRLGFDEPDLEEAIELLRTHPNLQVVTVFTHLAGSDESKHDSFSDQQVQQFKRQYSRIQEALGIAPIRHVLNSPGILRFSDYQFEMVRLGIGLYGVNPTENEHEALRPVATLKTVISQIKKVKKGESIGYGRRGLAEVDTTLATIAIGYADGFSRAFSRGVGEVVVNGKRVPVLGNVCMDMTMVNITGVDAHEGDEVIIFGKDLPIHEVATKIGTIPYEILTNTSERVKRVYFAEGI